MDDGPLRKGELYTKQELADIFGFKISYWDNRKEITQKYIDQFCKLKVQPHPIDGRRKLYEVIEVFKQPTDLYQDTEDWLDEILDVTDDFRDRLIKVEEAKDRIMEVIEKLIWRRVRKKSEINIEIVGKGRERHSGYLEKRDDRKGTRRKGME